MLGRTNFGGGNKINGIIEEYKVASGGNVSAGDFVRFINSNFTATEKQVGINCYGDLNAILLDDNKVFFAYGSSSNKLEAAICEISNSTISFGTSLVICNESSSGKCISLTKLENNKVMIVHMSGNEVKATLCSIDDNITIDSTHVIASFSGSCDKIKSFLLCNNKICIVFGKANLLQAVICEVNNNSVEVGTLLTLDTSYYAGTYFSASKIEDNKIIVIHGGGNSNTTNHLYGAVCTVEGNIITKHASTILVDSSQHYNAGLGAELTMLEPNKFCITHGYASSSINNSLLFAFICVIKNEDIIAYTDVQITSDNSVEKANAQPIALDKNSLFIQYTNKAGTTNYYYGYGVLCRIYNTIVNVETNNELPSSVTSSAYQKYGTVIINDNLLFLIRNTTGGNLYSYLVEHHYNEINKSNGFEKNIVGLAKISGTAGQTIKVYTPKIENIESEEI